MEIGRYTTYSMSHITSGEFIGGGVDRGAALIKKNIKQSASLSGGDNNDKNFKETLQQ